MCRLLGVTKFDISIGVANSLSQSVPDIIYTPRLPAVQSGKRVHVNVCASSGVCVRLMQNTYTHTHTLSGTYASHTLGLLGVVTDTMPNDVTHIYILMVCCCVTAVVHNNSLDMFIFRVTSKCQFDNMAHTHTRRSVCYVKAFSLNILRHTID